MADAPPLPLNCPVCGVPFRFLKNDDSTGVRVALYHCPMPGVYYFDHNGLMPGTPPPPPPGCTTHQD